jgi:hypothetical protein
MQRDQVGIRQYGAFVAESERPEEVAGEANDVVGIDCIGRAS